MILGVGIDILEIDRLELALQRPYGHRLILRLFTEGERAYAAQQKHPAVHLSGRFAAKEAVAKALGTGLSGLGWKDIEVVHDAAGRPIVHLSEKARAHFSDPSLLLSITHTRTYAMAVAIWQARPS